MDMSARPGRQASCHARHSAEPDACGRSPVSILRPGGRPPGLAQLDRLPRPHRLVRGQHDAQAVHGVAHVVRRGRGPR
ncbi:MAG: hypothetical protein MZV70_42700 [Desulfobacterales bacterium]|nr:hypothetical protein [Desulfobacterales bacterium]